LFKLFPNVEKNISFYYVLQPQLSGFKISNSKFKFFNGLNVNTHIEVFFLFFIFLKILFVINIIIIINILLIL
jgi:hypothetical protein